MPKLPIDDAPLSGAPDAPTDTGLPAGGQSRVARLREGDDTIDRVGAASRSLLDASRALRAAESDPAEIGPDFTGHFLDKTDRAHADILRKAPPGQRPQLENDLNVVRGQVAGLAAETEATGRAVRRRIGLRDALDANAELVRLDGRALDGAAARMDGVIDALDLPADRRDALQAYVRGVLGDAAVDGLLDDPADAQAALAAGQFDGYLDRQAKAARSQEIDALLERQTVQASANGLLALSQQAAAGALDPAALDAAVSGGRIGAADASRLRGLDANARLEADARRAGVQRVAAADGPLDPDSAEDRHAVDAYWDTVKESFGSGDPAAARKAELGFVTLKGVLPTALRRKYEGLLLSADPALVVSGAEAVTALEEIDLRLTRDIAPDRLRLARAVAGYADLALPPDRVVALARDEIDTTVEAASASPVAVGDAAASTATRADDNRMMPPSQAATNAVPRMEIDASANVAVDRDLSNRVFRTSRGFSGFLEELRQLSSEDAIARAGKAGLDGNTAGIVHDILDAAGRDGDSREATLQHVERSIDQLPGADDRTKRRLTDMLAGVRKFIDDPEKLTRVLAVNRELFRGRTSRLANVDPNALEARRLAEFQQKTGLIARPVTETLTPQQGDPDDLTDVVTRDVGPGDTAGSRQRISFYRPGSDTPFLTLLPSAANAIMTRPEKAAERLDFIARWRSGELSGDALIAEAEKLLFPEKNSPYIDIESEDLELKSAAFDAFVEAKKLIESGKDADAVLAAFMPSIIPQAYQDPAAAADLILDFLPIIGGIRAVYFAMQDIEELRRAKAAGDFTAVNNASMSLVFAVAGLIPVAGPLFRNAKAIFLNILRKPSVANYLRTTRRVKRVHSWIVLPRRIKIQDAVKVAQGANAETVFAPVWHKFTDKQQTRARGLINNIQGAAAYRELSTLLENFGFTRDRTRGARTVEVKIKRKQGEKKGEAGTVAEEEVKRRNFDEFIQESFEFLFGTFIRRRAGKGGTLIEIKGGGGVESAQQKDLTNIIIKQIKAGGSVNTVASERGAAIAAVAVELAHVPYKDVPENWFSEVTHRLFKNTNKRKSRRTGEKVKFTDQEIGWLVDALQRWHLEVRSENFEHITLGQVLVALSLEAQAMARANSILKEGSAELERSGG